MLEITIGNTYGRQAQVGFYLDKYRVHIDEVYASQPNFTAVSGKAVNNYLGDVRRLEVDFEAMSTEQMNELFQTIKHYGQKIPISYVDPQYAGITSKEFKCPNLPAATYFESDDGIQFWTVPTVTFIETDESAQTNWGEYG